MDLVAGRVYADERRPIRHIDWMLLLIVAALVIVGLLLLYSATRTTLLGMGLSPVTRVKKQLVTAVLGAVAMLVLITFDYRFLKIYAGFIYGGVVLMLVAVQIPGVGATDTFGIAQRYFNVGGFQITPSEFTKLAVVIMLATVLSELRTPVPTVRDLIRLLVIGAIPLGLVFIQPDIGTSIVLVAIVVGMLIVAGTRAKHLAVLWLAGMVLIFGALQMGVIKQYQLQRITAFLDLPGVPADARYNLDQSLIAVGSGGMLGKGYLQGSQTNLDYVPAQFSDFIFTVAGEEFGFVGCLVLLSLYGLLLWRAIRIAYLSKDPFGTYLAAGIASMFAIQMFVNVGMVIGIMPITGIPLPFISYGGSSMIACFLAIGVLESIHMRRFK
ncbi:MAG: rod shape-determining protein RodA [Planctomycetaceae bacterium]